MSFSQAWQKANDKKGNQVDLSTIASASAEIEVDPDQVPMMYRAQIEGRCSLQFIKNNQSKDKTNLEVWTEEWINAIDDSPQPRYQYSDPEEVLQEGAVFRFKLSFPFRVFSNCGQDSLARPVIDGKGIPLLPGSSIKGLFRRACQQRDKAKSTLERLTAKYCGDADQPGILRFHPAYPIGDWASTVTENAVSYKILDVVFPQQNRQVGQDNKTKGAFALVSFDRPTFIFSITSTELLTLSDWEIVKAILKAGLSQGLGGKTSSGYGLPFPALIPDVQTRLIGSGITPVLLSGEPEFRPNLFKAALRGHSSRLLAGCCNDENLINGKVKELFGSTQSPSEIDLYCDLKSSPNSWEKTFDDLTLDLYLKVTSDSQRQAKVNFLRAALKFAYTMAGFGKSWRRVWHKDFYPQRDYDKLIGCHWRSNQDWIDEISSIKDLQVFLNSLEPVCRELLLLNSQTSLGAVDWRDAWHRDRVSVYCQVVTQSQVIGCFHDERFKTTPAIGGRKPGDKRPTAVSSVWHRMLPIDKDQYLEIITLFHGGKDSQWRSQWEQNGKDQLLNFVAEIEKELSFCWGTDLRAKDKR